MSDGITDSMNGCGPYVPGTGPHGKTRKKASKQVSEELSHNEDQIRKQCPQLAKRLLRDLDPKSNADLELAVNLVQRGLGPDVREEQKARAAYSFLLTNGVEEQRAWLASGMHALGSIG